MTSTLSMPMDLSKYINEYAKPLTDPKKKKYGTKTAWVFRESLEFKKYIYKHSEWRWDDVKRHWESKLINPDITFASNFKFKREVSEEIGEEYLWLPPLVEAFDEEPDEDESAFMYQISIEWLLINELEQLIVNNPNRFIA